MVAGAPAWNVGFLPTCLSLQIGGGGLYAIVGARIWLGGPGEARILVDSDGNVPSEVQEVERDFGNDLFVWREGRPTGSAAIVYRGGKRRCVPVVRLCGRWCG